MKCAMCGEKTGTVPIPGWEGKVLFCVAPHAGAWIETLSLIGKALPSMSPPMRGRGLKHSLEKRLADIFCRPPCGGVD